STLAPKCRQIIAINDPDVFVIRKLHPAQGMTHEGSSQGNLREQSFEGRLRGSAQSERSAPRAIESSKVALSGLTTRIWRKADDTRHATSIGQIREPDQTTNDARRRRKVTRTYVRLDAEERHKIDAWGFERAHIPDRSAKFARGRFIGKLERHQHRRPSFSR